MAQICRLVSGVIVEPVVTVKSSGCALCPDCDFFCAFKLGRDFSSYYERAALTRIKSAGMVTIFAFRPTWTHKNYKFVIAREIMCPELDGFISGNSDDRYSRDSVII